MHRTETPPYEGSTPIALVTLVLLVIISLKHLVAMYFKTPLRYPGGKGKLTDFVKLILAHNDLIGGEYIEPYAGGAGVAINLLLDGYVRHVHLNDLNRSVYSFWRAIFESTERFCNKISNTPITIDEWCLQKEIQLNPSKHSMFDLGFSTFFLNRTNRSGIIRAGVIGGKNQDGVWRLNARFNKGELIERIQALRAFRKQVTLYNFDAAVFLQDVLPTLPRDSLVYLDPPYFVKGHGLYENHYSLADHETIAELVQAKVTHPWLVSYDRVAEICSLYAKCSSLKYGVSYSAQVRYRGAEAMFFGPSLRVPAVDSPTSLIAA